MASVQWMGRLRRKDGIPNEGMSRVRPRYPLHSQNLPLLPDLL
jgi:hypothetical protein